MNQLEVNNRKKTGNSLNTWKPNSTLLSNPWVWICFCKTQRSFQTCMIYRWCLTVPTVMESSHHLR